MWFTKERNHALFGERLALDIDNAFSAVAEGLVGSFREQEDFEGFQMSCIVNFGLDTQITEEEFKKGDINKLIDQLYNEATEKYNQHKEEIQKTCHPGV